MTSAFDELLDLAGKLGIAVRHAHLGGGGGGLACFKNRRQLFVDQDAAPDDQLEQTARAMANLPELEGVFLRPDVRKLLEEYGGKRNSKSE